MFDKLCYEYYESLDSTNERIKERARNGAEEGLVISADRQTAGRGRIGRKWQSPQGECVATSMLIYQNDIPLDSIPSITVLCGLAVRSALSQLYGMECLIKWPNDIILNGKKICGILVEYETLSNGLSFLVVGIGVNVHQKSFSDDLADKATSIDMELLDTTIRPVHRREIVEVIWTSFMTYYKEFILYNNLSIFKEEYEKHLVNIGNRVRIERAEASYDAIARGISDSGGLIIYVNGEEQEIRNYEVSVRGLYGYV
ncbi:MAG: biotin--[acetyl-CoA-carboxylase] ligase [Eubacterium sp.]|nr:biotin--[acetyl-CoA-carboxylase] ligase [Eubacterium sp.]